MSIEGIKQPSKEISPRAISEQLMKKLGTSDIPFTFRTSRNSLYVSDRKLQTVRYNLVHNSLQPPSAITVYLDDKYLNSDRNDISKFEYLANTALHREGILILDDPELIKANKAAIHGLGDIPESMKVEEINNALNIVVFDSVAGKTVRKTPVSIIPKVGFHPVEFFAQRDARGNSKHVGNVIENLVITNRMDENEALAAVESLAVLSVENKKDQSPLTTLDDLDLYLD